MRPASWPGSRARATSCSRSVRATSTASRRISSKPSRERAPVRGGRRARATHDDRDRRAGALVRAAGVGRRGRRGARLRGRARAAGLAGFEFACAIPGTLGGGVRMNAGAYGRDWAAVMARALVVDLDGEQWYTPEDLNMAYRHSDLRRDQVVARVELRLGRDDPDAIKAAVRALNAKRKAAQPTNRRTFGSVFKNPDHELSAGRMLQACGLRGHRVGGAQISPKHANFIE